MPKFTLRIDCDNAAFEYPHVAIAIILETVARRVSELTPDRKQHNAIPDTNGNRVGFWTYTP